MTLGERLAACPLVSPSAGWGHDSRCSIFLGREAGAGPLAVIRVPGQGQADARRDADGDAFVAPGQELKRAPIRGTLVLGGGKRWQKRGPHG